MIAGSNDRLVPWALFTALVAAKVWLEAPISVTSTNPVRSLGPAVISGQWQAWWVYWLGPLVGMLAAVLACSFLAKRIEVATLSHFDSDRDRLFRRPADKPLLKGESPS